MDLHDAYCSKYVLLSEIYVNVVEVCWIYGSVTSRCSGTLWQEVTEEDERIISMFMASDAAPQRTLADIIMERINDKGGDAMATDVEGELPCLE